MSEALDQRLLLTAAETTIDGSDAGGNPSGVAPFLDRTYPTVVTMIATQTPVIPPPSEFCPCQAEFGGELFIRTADVVVRGLNVRRQQPAQEDICCGDQDLVELGAGAAGSIVENCWLDGGGAAITDATTPSGQTGQATGKDCVEPKNTGATEAEPMIVRNSEISFCLDRGLKLEANFVRAESNWIHNNLRCGVFALVPEGQLASEDNLIEENGLNCPSGAPPNCQGQVVTRSTAPQVAAQGESTEVQLTGDIVRTGPLNGIFFENGSSGIMTDAFVCGLDDTGILLERSEGGLEGVVLRGTAVVLNHEAGVKFRDDVAADLGIDGRDDAGHNAFAGNRSSRQVLNVMNEPAPIVPAQGNQWEHCYPASAATADKCDVSAISKDDTNNSTGDLDKVDVENPEPYQSTAPVVITAVQPTMAVQGMPVRISGGPFDAISAYAAGAGCANLAQGNSCAPLSGTCVEFLVDGEWMEAEEVLAVTPTSVTVASPLTCAVPTMVRVIRLDLGGDEIVSNRFDFCTNSNP